MTCKIRYIELFLIKEICVSQLPTKFLYEIPYAHRNMICYFQPSCKCHIKLSFSLSRLLVSYVAHTYPIVNLTYLHARIISFFSPYTVIADFGVCPFTIDKNRAGIPMGGVRY